MSLSLDSIRQNFSLSSVSDTISDTISNVRAQPAGTQIGIIAGIAALILGSMAVVYKAVSYLCGPAALDADAVAKQATDFANDFESVNKDNAAITKTVEDLRTFSTASASKVASLKATAETAVTDTTSDAEKEKITAAKVKLQTATKTADDAAAALKTVEEQFVTVEAAAKDAADANASFTTADVSAADKKAAVEKLQIAKGQVEAAAGSIKEVSESVLAFSALLDEAKKAKANLATLAKAKAKADAADAELLAKQVADAAEKAKNNTTIKAAVAAPVAIGVAALAESALVAVGAVAATGTVAAFALPAAGMAAVAGGSAWLYNNFYSQKTVVATAPNVVPPTTGANTTA